MFQEDYFDLLNAAETGMLITYNPSKAEELLQNFNILYSSAEAQVCAHTHTPSCRHVCTCTMINTMSKNNHDDNILCSSFFQVNNIKNLDAGVKAMLTAQLAYV